MSTRLLEANNLVKSFPKGSRPSRLLDTIRLGKISAVVSKPSVFTTVGLQQVFTTVPLELSCLTLLVTTIAEFLQMLPPLDEIILQPDLFY